MARDAGMDENDHESERDDDGRFLRLFIHHEQTLRIYARTLAPTLDDADDVLQEASMVMLRKFKQLESYDYFLQWAKVIIRFEALHSRRKFARDRLVFSDELLIMLAVDFEADALTEDALMQERVYLRRCLGKLSSSHQELLLAPYAGSGRVKDLAERSRRTSNSLYKLLGRLRAKVQNCIEKEMSRSTQIVDILPSDF